MVKKYIGPSNKIISIMAMAIFLWIQTCYSYSMLRPPIIKRVERLGQVIQQDRDKISNLVREIVSVLNGLWVATLVLLSDGTMVWVGGYDKDGLLKLMVEERLFKINPSKGVVEEEDIKKGYSTKVPSRAYLERGMVKIQIGSEVLEVPGDDPLSIRDGKPLRLKVRGIEESIIEKSTLVSMGLELENEDGRRGLTRSLVEFTCGFGPEGGPYLSFRSVYIDGVFFGKLGQEIDLRGMGIFSRIIERISSLPFTYITIHNIIEKTTRTILGDYIISLFNKKSELKEILLGDFLDTPFNLGYNIDDIPVRELVPRINWDRLKRSLGPERYGSLKRAIETKLPETPFGRVMVRYGYEVRIYWPDLERDSLYYRHLTFICYKRPSGVNRDYRTAI